jgi:tetratricopeptide (TPR) repeat protein
MIVSGGAVAGLENPVRPISETDGPGPCDVEAQLLRIMASGEFRNSERMRRFLQLSASEALSGNAGSLKEYRIGTEVFDKPDSFDPRTDPIVRNEARRLRNKLSKYYLSEGNTDPILIDLPKGGYAATFAFRRATAVLPTEDSSPSLNATRLSREKWWLVASLCFLAGAVPLLWWLQEATKTHGSAIAKPVSTATEARTGAAEAFAVGKHLLFGLRRQGITESRLQLEKAIRLDPAFAEAYAVLAINHQISAIFGSEPRDVAIRNSRELAARAAQLGPHTAIVELSLAIHQAVLKENYMVSEPHFLHALTLLPNDAIARAAYAITCLLQLGRVEEAERQARTATSLDPSSYFAAYALALAEYCSRDYSAAIIAAQKALELEPESEIAAPLLIECYLASGKPDEAWFFIEKIGAADGQRGDFYRARIHALGNANVDVLQQARQLASTASDPLALAQLFAVSKDATSSVHWLQIADKQHNFTARLQARYAPDYDSMRTSREFAALLASFGKPQTN